MTKGRKIQVKDAVITILTLDETDFISLMDITSGFPDGSSLIGKWVTNKNTLEYLSTWEKINNPVFSYPKFGVIENEARVNMFIMSVGQWIGGNNIKNNTKTKKSTFTTLLAPKVVIMRNFKSGFNICKYHWI